MINVERLEYWDLLVFSVILLAIIYFFLYAQHSRQSYSTKLFRWFILSVIIVGVLDTATYLFLGKNNSALRIINYISTALFFCFNLLPASLGLLYLSYITSITKQSTIRKVLFYLIPVYINVAFVIINFFFDGFLFCIDASNEYHRGIAAYIGNGVTLLFASIVVVGFFRNKQMINGRITQVIITLTLLPVLGVVVQMLFIGLSFSIPAYSLAIFIAFLLMERNELQKDPLTLLNSRAQMENRLSFKLKSQEPFTAIMIDVNNFKGINDIHGHTVGDQVLKDVSRILVSHANYEDYVCRFGGDEFFVILESPKDIAKSYIKRIDQTLKEYSVHHQFIASLSYGAVYVTPSGGMDVDRLVHMTDQCMYQDKEQRKNQTL